MHTVYKKTRPIYEICESPYSTFLMDFLHIPEGQLLKN